MSPEDTASPELEAMRSQVWQEVEQAWQEEVIRKPELGKDDPKVVYGDLTPKEEAEIDPILRGDYEAGFKAKKIGHFLYNFSSNMPSPYNNYAKHLPPDFVFSDTHTVYSPLQYGKTIKEYEDQIFEAMKQMGLSVEDYQRLEEERGKRTYGLTELKYQETLLEVFTRLRLMNPNAPKFAR